MRLILLSWAFVLLASGVTSSQCLLANPSFELTGSGGSNFGGWNQFGNTGISTDATHGHLAARVTGPDLGGWDVSGYWQKLDTSPGERWAASVKGWHTSGNPLSGQSRAILNIEWRDASENLISYESYTVADASTPVDEIQTFYVESGPAPSGTATTRLLLGVLQAPGDPVPDVYYDEATFENLGPPTVEEIQWNDFPGGRTLDFSGYTWRVKGPGYYGPGPSLFSDDPSCVWVDGEGKLHLTIKRIGGSWYSTEVALVDLLGYGDYVFTTETQLDLLDRHAVLGLFLWEYRRCYDPAYSWWNPSNEMDIEFSRWDDPGNEIAHYVVQPYDYPGNIVNFDISFSPDEVTSHAFRWLPDKVEYRSWRGGPADEAPENMINSWTYTGPHIPRPERPRVHMNLWQFNGSPSTEQEVVISQFTFVPADNGAGISQEDHNIELYATTNPFSDQTTIHYCLKEGGMAHIAIYDVTGRLVRDLGSSTGTQNSVVWDGCDTTGRRVSAGIYLCHIRTDREATSRKLVVVR